MLLVAIAAPQPTLAEPVAEKPAPVSAQVPDLKPTDDVRQAVALGDPERQPEVVLPAEPPMEEDVPEAEPKQEAAPVPVESNIFEEVDQAAHEPAAIEGMASRISGTVITAAVSCGAWPCPCPCPAPPPWPVSKRSLP
jgi:hypothetical protein